MTKLSAASVLISDRNASILLHTLVVTFHVLEYPSLLAQLSGRVWAEEQQRPAVVSSERTAHEGKAEGNVHLTESFYGTSYSLLGN